MNKQKIIGAVLIALGTIGFGFWRWKAAGKTRPAHCVVVFDRSESVASGWECTLQLARYALNSPYLGRNSTLTVTATGDASTANEPMFVASYEVTVIRRVLERRNTTASKREELLADLKAKCELPCRTKTSPIYLAIKRAVEQLRAAGCDENANCFVLVQSDLEENINLEIKRALDGDAAGNKSPATVINNDGIAIIVSGVAEKVGVSNAGAGTTRYLTNIRDQQRPDRIQQVWQGLFTSPKRVTFQPYCPRTQE